MSKVEVNDLGEPEDVITYPFGVNHQVRLAATVISRDVQQPGWSWIDHIQPIVGTSSCEFHHRGVVLRGRLGIRTDEGKEVIIGPDHVFDIEPGHVGWVVGDEELVTLDWAGGAGFASPSVDGERVMASILFTDIVDSTGLARRLGDAAWKRTPALHDETVRTVVRNFRGREIETAGLVPDRIRRHGAGSPLRTGPGGCPCRGRNPRPDRRSHRRGGLRGRTPSPPRGPRRCPHSRLGRTA